MAIFGGEICHSSCD